MSYKAHIGSVLPIKNTPMPVDNDTYTYFNFNNNLVGSITPTYPIVNHNNIMYTDDFFDDISVKGKHGKGISIDGYLDGIRNPTYLLYDIGTGVKTMSFWMKSNTIRIPTMASDRPLLLLGGDLGSQTSTYFQCMLTRSDDPRFTSANKIGVNMTIAGSSYYCSINEVDATDGNWHFVTVELNKVGKVRLFVDGYFAETASYVSDINVGNLLRVGHNHIPSSQSQIYTGLADCVFDDLCIRTAHYSDDEILAWCMSNREFYNPYDYSITV